VPSGLEFGVKKCIIYSDLETTSHGREERNTLYLWFVGIKQFIRQANGPVSIMSNCAVNDRNFKQGGNSSDNFPKIILLLA
jgi:hypothetical protein